MSVQTKLERVTGTHTEPMLITLDVLDKWKSPPFQRGRRMNQKVKDVARLILETKGIIPGVIHLGVLDGHVYLLDGQHRTYAFRLTGIEEGIADVRTVQFDTMAEMGKEFVALNSRIVTMKPDDVLRGLELSNKFLRAIRQECPYVGYDNVRRSATSSPIVSMATLLRCWEAAHMESPANTGKAVLDLAEALTEEDTEQLILFVRCCHTAWGRDPEYFRLWGALTTMLCGWLYRRLVLLPPSNITKISRDLFTKCLMSVSADRIYADWAVGRTSNRDRDRAPAYTKLKAIFAKRIEAETGKKPKLPSPSWSSS